MKVSGVFFPAVITPAHTIAEASDMWPDSLLECPRHWQLKPGRFDGCGCPKRSTVSRLSKESGLVCQIWGTAATSGFSPFSWPWTGRWGAGLGSSWTACIPSWSQQMSNMVDNDTLSSLASFLMLWAGFRWIFSWILVIICRVLTDWSRPLRGLSKVSPVSSNHLTV